MTGARLFTGSILIALLLSICGPFSATAQTRKTSAQYLGEVRSSVVLDRSYQLGAKIEIALKKGEALRLRLGENPTEPRITEIYLWPKKDFFRIYSVYTIDGKEKCSTSGKKYETVRDIRWRLGSHLYGYIAVSPDAADKVTIGFMAEWSPSTTDEIRRKQEKAREERLREITVISAEERVSGFVRLWSAVKYNFAFFDQVPDLDWDGILDEYLPKVMKEQTTEEYYRLLQSCVARLNDGHTDVWMPPVFGSRTRLPIRVVFIDRKAIVSELAQSANKDYPDLKPGFELTHLGGRAIQQILAEQIYPLLPASPRQYRDRHASRRLVIGKKEEEVSARFVDIEGKTHDLRLSFSRWRFSAPEWFQCREVEDGILYISLRSFTSDEIVEKFGDVFAEVLRAEGLLLDLRDNGGGSSNNGYGIIKFLIDRAIKSSRWKTPQYRAAYEAWGRDQEWHHGDHGTIRPRWGGRYSGPVVVLIGPGTVSAAEDFVVALDAADRVTLVGSKTAGTTGQPLMLELPQGGGARICTKRDVYPDGREFVGIGIAPDVEVVPSRADIASGRDAVLEEGVKVLKRLIEQH